MQTEQDLDSGIGVTSWLVEGMKIQENQLRTSIDVLPLYADIHRSELVAFIRRQGKKPSAEQRVQINRKRETLRKCIDDFNDSFNRLFPSLQARSELDEVTLMEIPYGDDVLGDHEDETDLQVVPTGEIEKAAIMLPSTCPAARRSLLKEAAQAEVELRKSQAENVLDGVRREIGHKSFLFRNNIALSVTKVDKTRGYAAVKAADEELRKHVRVYKQARNALIALNCPPDIAGRFKELLPNKLVALKSVYEPNSRGQGAFSLPWFWSLQVGIDATSSEYLDECKCSVHIDCIFLNQCNIVHRVNWMRARVKKMRWEEESILVPSEMHWTRLFFENRSRGSAVCTATAPGKGHKAYAYKQEAMWLELASEAGKAFASCLVRHVVPGDELE
jgi:hypothetical protein